MELDTNYIIARPAGTAIHVTNIFRNSLPNVNTPLASVAATPALNGTVQHPSSSSALQAVPTSIANPPGVVQPQTPSFETSTVTPIAGTEIPNVAAAGVSGAVATAQPGFSPIDILLIIGVLIVLGALFHL